MAASRELVLGSVRRIPFRRMARYGQGIVRGQGSNRRKNETKQEYDEGLEKVNEDLSCLSSELLPITTRAYLYLHGLYDTVVARE